MEVYEVCFHYLEIREKCILGEILCHVGDQTVINLMLMGLVAPICLGLSIESL